MSVYRRVKEYKDGQPKLQPTTIRATEECLERVKKFANDNDLRVGVALWLLVEEALEGTEGYAAQKVEDPIKELRAEIDALKQESASMWAFLEELTGSSSKSPDENLSSVPSEDTVKVTNESHEHESNSESKTAEETD